MSDYIQTDTPPALVIEPARGRAAPPHTIEREVIHVSVGGRVVGVIAPKELKGQAQFDLERARGILEMIDWLQTYAETSDEDAQFVEDYLASRPIKELTDFSMTIGDVIRQALDVPKARGRRSTSR